jgi:[ribosomal protein S5]-alanine N-acetyltransferase
MPVTLETQRLVFRELTWGDIDFVFKMLSHPQVMRFYPRCYTRKESRTWLERQRDRYLQYGHGLWLVSDKNTLTPVGQVGLVTQFLRDKHEIEVGYLIQFPYWRQGFATEAAMACRDYAFDFLGKKRVISLIRPENRPSRGVALKLGMHPEEHIEYGGFRHIVYSVNQSRQRAGTDAVNNMPRRSA